jgi:hypothetical protein
VSVYSLYNKFIASAILNMYGLSTQQEEEQLMQQFYIYMYFAASIVIGAIFRHEYI